MSEHIDRPKSVRKGEELDLEPLASFLRENIEELPSDAEVAVEQFTKGHSNLTYMIRAGGHEYVLRRPPLGHAIETAHDMAREFRILSKLAGVYPPAPEPLVYCEDTSVLGAPFYVMRRIRGVILRRDIPSSLGVDAETKRRLDTTLIDSLAELHALDYQAAGLADLGKPKGYVRRQVEGWTKRYYGSQTDEIESVDRIANWLSDHMPSESGVALIHNDFKYDNLVLDPGDLTRVVGVLDWEMSTLGDPLMDLGTTLGYWVDPSDGDEAQMLRMTPSTEPGSLTRQQLADRYAQKSGRELSNLVFYYCYGLFKTAVVAQQLYYRYKHGFTKDERFAPFILGVRILCDNAVRAADAGKI